MRPFHVLCVLGFAILWPCFAAHASPMENDGVWPTVSAAHASPMDNDAAHASPLDGIGKFAVPAREGRINQLYASDGSRQVAGCVVVNPEQKKVLLITSSKTKDRWVLPKGGWEDDENAEKAALRETREEAGVDGKIYGFIGVFRAAKTGNKNVFFELHPTELADTWAEKRQRQWVDYDVAIELAAKDFMKEAIKGCSLSPNPTVVRKPDPGDKVKTNLWVSLVNRRVGLETGPDDPVEEGMSVDLSDTTLAFLPPNRRVGLETGPDDPVEEGMSVDLSDTTSAFRRLGL